MHKLLGSVDFNPVVLVRLVSPGIGKFMRHADCQAGLGSQLEQKDVSILWPASEDKKERGSTDNGET